MGCNKVKRGIECLACGYPYSEALYSDSDPPMLCDASDQQLDGHVGQFIWW